MSKNRKIAVQDRCSFCGHWFGEDEVPARVVTEARFQWLLKAVELAMCLEGDDDWKDWLDEGAELTKEEFKE